MCSCGGLELDVSCNRTYVGAFLNFKGIWAKFFFVSTACVGTECVVDNGGRRAEP